MVANRVRAAFDTRQVGIKLDQLRRLPFHLFRRGSILLAVGFNVQITDSLFNFKGVYVDTAARKFVCYRYVSRQATTKARKTN